MTVTNQRLVEILTTAMDKPEIANALIQRVINTLNKQPEPDFSKAGFGKSQREWVGLTDEEIKEIIGPWGDQPVKGYTRKLFDQIESKLKEKNT